MIANDKIAARSKLKICADVGSAFFILVAPTSLWSAFIWPPIKISFSIFDLQFLIFFIDLVPFAIGLIWLEVSYHNFLQEKFSIYHRWHLRGFFLFIGIFVPLILMKLQK